MINLIDLDDNPPLFFGIENRLASSVVSINVNETDEIRRFELPKSIFVDLDSNPNSKNKLFILNPTDPYTFEDYHLKNLDSIDFEKTREITVWIGCAKFDEPQFAIGDDFATGYEYFST